MTPAHARSTNAAMPGYTSAVICRYPHVAATEAWPRQADSTGSSARRSTPALAAFSSVWHTYLTLLAINGVHPKVMQELAGHYSSQISMDIYTHVNIDSKREAVAAVASVF